FGGGHGYAGRGFYGYGHWHGHGHGGFYGGFWCFWPGWWWGGPYWWPYDYDGYYDDYGYPGPYDYDGAYPQYDDRDYLMLGHDSGRALRLHTVSQDWLVEYLRAYIINAPLDARDDFRRGFVAGYGDGASSVLKRAIKEARHPPPPAETAPPATKSAEPAK
ncbi:MAG TPA: hypothetical protein VMP11_14530, partial [Verrucomicrobiae bacterium]|nr:hypothetical protein [Verrucomicrobiae bacterium]